jgi:hypothetical protein
MGMKVSIGRAVVRRGAAVVNPRDEAARGATRGLAEIGLARRISLKCREVSPFDVTLP